MTYDPSIDVEELVDTALMDALTSIDGISTLAPGGVHNTLRRQGSAFPVIVFRLMRTTESPRYGARDGQERFPYDVKVIAPANKQQNVGTILGLVHGALQGVPMTIDGLHHLQTMRTSRIPRYPENLDGTTYVHRGATYVIEISHPV